MNRVNRHSQKVVPGKISPIIHIAAMPMYVRWMLFRTAFALLVRLRIPAPNSHRLPAFAWSEAVYDSIDFASRPTE